MSFRQPFKLQPPDVLELILVHNVGVDEADLSCDLRFNVAGDDPIKDVSSAVPGKWVVRYQGVRYVAWGLTNADYNELNLISTASGPEAGPDCISYAANPSDIEDTRGRKLAAISQRPIGG